MNKRREKCEKEKRHASNLPSGEKKWKDSAGKHGLEVLFGRIAASWTFKQAKETTEKRKRKREKNLIELFRVPRLQLLDVCFLNLKTREKGFGEKRGGVCCNLLQVVGQVVVVGRYPDEVGRVDLRHFSHEPRRGGGGREGGRRRGSLEKHIVEHHPLDNEKKKKKHEEKREKQETKPREAPRTSPARCAGARKRQHRPSPS